MTIENKDEFYEVLGRGSGASLPHVNAVEERPIPASGVMVSVEAAGADNGNEREHSSNDVEINDSDSEFEDANNEEDSDVISFCVGLLGAATCLTLSITVAAYSAIYINDNLTGHTRSSLNFLSMIAIPVSGALSLLVGGAGGHYIGNKIVTFFRSHSAAAPDLREANLNSESNAVFNLG